jgi:hypothetical protein
MTNYWQVYFVCYMWRPFWVSYFYHLLLGNLIMKYSWQQFLCLWGVNQARLGSRMETIFCAGLTRNVQMIFLDYYIVISLYQERIYWSFLLLKGYWKAKSHFHMKRLGKSIDQIIWDRFSYWDQNHTINFNLKRAFIAFSYIFSSAILNLPDLWILYLDKYNSRLLQLYDRLYKI